MKNYTVFYKTATYNPYRTYAQNANRKAASKSFDNEAKAKEFAKEVNGRVYYLGVRV